MTYCAIMQPQSEYQIFRLSTMLTTKHKQSEMSRSKSANEQHEKMREVQTLTQFQR